jgi:hypothetical protein
MAPILLIAAMVALRAHTQKADSQITKQIGDFGFARLSRHAGCQRLHTAAITSCSKKTDGIH